MTLKELFLNEVKKDCRVIVSVSGRQEPITGTVVEIDGNLCRIRTQNGAPRVSIESITSYDILEEHKSADSADSVPESDQTVDERLARNDKTIASMQPKPIKALNVILESSVPDDYAIVDWNGIYEELIENDPPLDLKREIDSIRSTFKNIKNQLGKMPAKDLDTRMHNLRAKILMLRQKYPYASRELYCMIAAMHFVTGNYEDALKYFEYGNDVYSAVYAAYRGGNSSKFTQLINQYIAAPSIHDPFLYKLYAENCLKTQDITALCNRVSEFHKMHILTEKDHNSLFCLCASGFLVAQVLGLPISWAIECVPGKELKCIEMFIKTLPGSWKKVMLEHTNDDDNSEQESNTLFKSTICTFHNDSLYGWINGNPNNHFFHITQVNCSDILRQVLARPDMAKGLEVSFRLGVPIKSNHDTAAYDIRLTERGVGEATKRLERAQSPKVIAKEITGYLQEYSYDFGKIYVEGEPYNVIEAQIVDPYLKGYLAISVHPDIRVNFIPARDRKGKRIANNVRLDDGIHFSDSEVKDMLRSRAITQVELDRWNNRTNATTEERREPVFEDYYRIPYVALEPVKIAVPKKSAETPKIAHKEDQPAIVPVRTSRDTVTMLPRLEPLPLPKENRFSSLPLIAPDQNYYEEAHKCLLEGNLEKAEELYIRALCARDRTESAVADMASQVFLRGDTSRIADAYQVVDAFKEFIPHEKEIILKIGICQKSKERPYQILLCHLINEHVKISEKANTKLHFLSVQGKTLRDLGEYEMALNSFSQWHQIYENEVQYRGQSAVSQYANALNYVKTGEAVCYYFLGDRIRAKNMAREVLRISSDNAVAQNILNDTLELQNMDDFADVILEDYPRIGNISEFAKSQITSAPISKLVKGNVENGKYTGTIKAASNVIRTLLDRQGKTPAERCDFLRVAANIISQLLARSNDAKDMHLLQKLHLTESDQRKYIGRSMAAFGDAILRDRGDTDVARYGFLQAIDVLDDAEEDYIRSIKHYIDTFYNARQEMAQIVEDDMSRRNVKYNFSILSKQQPFDVDEFILGMINLCVVIKKSHIGAYSEIIQYLKVSLDTVDWDRWFDIISLSYEDVKFEQNLEQAAEKGTEYRNQLLGYIEQLPSLFLSQHRSKEMAEVFANAGQSVFLSMTDKNRMRTLQAIIQNFSGYFTTVQFQYRSNLLQTTEDDILKLIQVISNQPTQFGYDILLPNLQKIHTNLQKEKENHYRKLPPDISISTTDVGAYMGMNNEVNLHLTISNGGTTSRGNERQMADNISIEITRISEGAEYLRMDTDFAGGIFGGEEAEVILVFRVTDPKVLLYGIDLSLRCSYRYNENRTVTKDEHVDYSDTIVIRQGTRTQIHNPYAAHIGQEMSDPAMFVGREKIIKKVTDAMVTDYGYNYGAGFFFYGQTRAGKSSVRVHLGNRIRLKDPGMIVVDLGNIDPKRFEEKSFYCDLLFRINDEIQENHTELFHELLERGIEAPPDSIYEADLDMVLAKFKRYLFKLSRAIRNKTMIVVLADEFSGIYGAIRKGRVSDDFMESWKAMLENYGLFTICFGQDDSPAFMLHNQNTQNAFRRMAVEMITYLEKPYAIELMQKPLKVSLGDGTQKPRCSTAVAEELYRLTAGSAYLIIKLCSLLVDYLNEKGAEYVTPGILQGFLKSRVFAGQNCIDEGDFEPQIGDRADLDAYPFNAVILLRIARASQNSGWADLSCISDTNLMPRDGQTAQRRKEELLRRLHERDVIEVEEGRRCRIKVALLNQWLLMKYGTEE